MKLLLVQPPIRHQVWAGVPKAVNDRGSHLFPSLSVMGLSSFVNQKTDHEAQVIDFRLDEPDVDAMGRRIASHKPDVLGITAMTHNLANVVDVISAARKHSPNTFIVVGGPHSNAFPEMAARLQGPDVAVYGDGEYALKGIMDAIHAGEPVMTAPGTITTDENGEIVRGADPVTIKDLDELPFPDRSWMPKGTYFTPGMREAETTTIISSRGCPYHCIFCSVPRNFRARSAKHVVEEMVECEQKYGIREVHFVDDLFNITEQRVIEISEEILRRDVKIIWGFKGSPRNVSEESLALAKRAGCVRAHYGVETYSKEGVNMMEKPATIGQVKRAFDLTNKVGIRAIAYMIIGSPHERCYADVVRVTPFTQRLNPDYVVYSLFSPYPDTESFHLGVKHGLWAPDVWERFMLDPKPGAKLPTTWLEHLSKDELVQAFKYVNRAFYFHPKVLLKTFVKVRRLSELKRVISGGLSLLRLWIHRPELRRANF